MDNFAIIHDTLKHDKWWRLFNLVGLRLKLNSPILHSYNPQFKGDPSYVTIISYVPTIAQIQGNPAEANLYSDWVLYSNELTPVNRNYSLNLSLLNIDYFKALNLSNHVQK